jgi:NADH dehydrogenase [ubiquinone] 1 alpha subcomplex assembly factor 1
MKIQLVAWTLLAASITAFAEWAYANQCAESEKVNRAVNFVQTDAMTHLLFNFSDAAVVEQWAARDDRVMGGVSQSRLRFDRAGHAVFEGVMSLAQNGGFASVRAQAPAPPVSEITHYVVEVQGDGKRYKLNMQMSGRFNQVSYQASFSTVNGVWMTLEIPVKSFEPSFRGQRVVDAPPLNAALVNQAGLMISDGQDGAFQLAIRKISASARAELHR